MKSIGLLLLVLCCDREPIHEVTMEEPPGPVELASERFPRFLDLQQGVVSRTCSPNPGVCHASGNYPDFSSAAGTLAAILAPCNVEIPDPAQGWDACERPADRLALTDFDFRAEIAQVERMGEGRARLVLADPSPRSGSEVARLEGADGEMLLGTADAFWITAELTEGERSVVLALVSDSPEAEEYYRYFYDGVFDSIVPGDPNGNGVFGAELDEVHASLVVPGDLEASYLWRRINGTAPGSRMPLANQPLSDDEYLAIACWIEGLSRESAVDQPIDYGACRSAAEAVTR